MRWHPLRLSLICALISSFPVTAFADRLDTAFEKAIGGYFAREFAAPYGIETDPILAGYVSRLGADVASESHRDDI
ncbi:MAG: hypothetical protein H8F28_04620, partial [Fibrella sp.]|nr:hypothetical protein [Armatimonadota bacterium]